MDDVMAGTPARERLCEAEYQITTKTNGTDGKNGTESSQYGLGVGSAPWRRLPYEKCSVRSYGVGNVPVPD